MELDITYIDVKEIFVETTTRGADILSDPSKYRPETRETADHSLPYVIATAIVDGNVLPNAFSMDSIKDPRKWEILPKIKVVANPEIDALFPKVKRARVTITTNDGRSKTIQTDFAKGTPENPLSDEEIVAKFKANSAGVISEKRMQEVLEKTWELEKIGKINGYTQSLIVDI